MKNLSPHASLFGLCTALVAAGLLAASAQQAPSLPITNATISARPMITLPRDGSEPGGLPLTFSVVSNNTASPGALVSNRQADVIYRAVVTNATDSVPAQNSNASALFMWWGGSTNRIDPWAADTNGWDTQISVPPGAGNGQPRRGKRRSGP